MLLGRRIYYDKSTGNIVHDTGERQGSVIKTTIEQDIATFSELSKRNRDTFDFIELPYGAYVQNFLECNGYRINPTTKILEFSYPDPNNPEAPQVFQMPLTDQIKELRSALKSTQDTLDFLLLS